MLDKEHPTDNFFSRVASCCKNISQFKANVCELPSKTVYELAYYIYVLEELAYAIEVFTEYREDKFVLSEAIWEWAVSELVLKFDIGSIPENNADWLDFIEEGYKNSMKEKHHDL